MMRLAVIEIGTNSIKYAIGELDTFSDELRIIEKQSTVSRLSQNMYQWNCISGDAMERNLQLIRNYMDIIKNKGAKLVSVLATSVLRDANNSQQFIKMAQELLGIEINVISGEQEAHYTYKASFNLIKDDGVYCTVDIGGGSTEITYGNKDLLIRKYSIDVGAVRLTEMFIHTDPVIPEELDSMTHYINNKLSKFNLSSVGDIKNLPNKDLPKCPKLLGVGGTIKSVGTMLMKGDYRSENTVHGKVIYRTDIESIYNSLIKQNIDQRGKIPGLDPKRADVIVAGITILLTIMRTFHFDEIIINSFGVLEGFMENYLLDHKGEFCLGQANN